MEGTPRLIVSRELDCTKHTERGGKSEPITVISIFQNCDTIVSLSGQNEYKATIYRVDLGLMFVNVASSPKSFLSFNTKDFLVYVVI